ncbi:MAG: NADPH:quinone oxidoreductase family protein [Rhodospirillaceae bacterium]|nr:NADPH:quinone oxidoreductase family protein [Rhodospirillaceae bacterium]MBT4689891.1 NADPH:quinone oxidoreductase family protein [Rhodospirillaceae bacterium]MBT5082000.1 NADPH:quinone oxidoreductase family protein [Rhodospirillaceae bacterium]MBT5524792.1 NADPH:quinone oxidoreductase family protein [Rhodospirillaceae bacterium]MBT5881167.1 NADPH:quinone oxidoreductase family protein [Rhodospirillaceae bacterium]
MRALICRAWGEIDTLEMGEMVPPVPGPGQVLIDVVATSANFADTIMVAGRYQTKPEFPFAPGLEGAGRVAAVGSGVTNVKPGDMVMAKLEHGGFAEQAVASATETWPLFAGMNCADGAAFLVAYLSAHLALRWQGRLEAGETLLVLGAAGGSGLAAVEIGKAMGATVIAGASSDERLAAVREHGADHVVNYSTEDLKGRVLEMTGGEGADVCFDPVGGDLFDGALSSLGWGGRFVHFGFVGGVPQVPANRLLVKHRSAVGSSYRYFTKYKPDLLARSMVELGDFYSQGHLHPIITHRRPLEDGVDALRLLTERKAFGKVIVDVAPELEV